MSKVLVVDDEEQIRKDLEKYLRRMNNAVYTAKTVEEARKIVLCKELDYEIIDLKLDFTSEFGGIKVVNFAKKNQPKIKTLILSAYPFADVKELLRKELKELNEENEPEKILKEFEDNYIYKGGKKNYILAILDKLEELGKRKNCFVIMPFSSTTTCTKDEWDEIFENVIKPAVENSEFNYQCTRLKIHFGSIFEDILDKLKYSELVVADITDRNPNVMYELGVRQTLGGPTILIAQNEADIPSDLLPFIVKIYGWKTKKEKDRFKNEIKEAIEHLEKNPHKAVSPVRKYFNPIGEES